ncbi:MAG: maleylpyruvate isomerase family mycothiol-dependent enzyme [Nocardioides sp.]
MNDIAALESTENARLVSTLDELDEARWSAPSLCDGWQVRHVVTHLLMPYELSVPRFLLKMTLARFDFDTLAARWPHQETRSREQLLSALRATPRQRFGVPGSPPEAPLSHLVIHAEDIYRPLGLPRGPSAAAAKVVLDQQTSPRFRKTVPKGLLDGLAYRATDTDWSFGTGRGVTGPAAALITTLAGRTAALDELAGTGADDVRARLRTV